MRWSKSGVKSAHQNARTRTAKPSVTNASPSASPLRPSASTTSAAPSQATKAATAMPRLPLAGHSEGEGRDRRKPEQRSAPYCRGLEGAQIEDGAVLLGH